MMHILLLCLINSKIHLRSTILADEADSILPDDGMKARWQQAYGIATPTPAAAAAAGESDEPAEDSAEGKLLKERRARIDKHPNAAILRKYAKQSSMWHKRRKRVALSASSLRQIRQEPHELQKILQQRIEEGARLRQLN